MPEVQSVGATDYSQYQPSQYEDYSNSYSTQPQVYDEGAAEVKHAAKNKLGATLLSAAIIGGIALWGGHAWGKKSADKELKQLQNAAEKYKEFAEKNAKELEKKAEEIINERLGGYKNGKNFAKQVKEEIKKLREALESLKDDAGEATEKAAEETKKAAEDAAK